MARPLRLIAAATLFAVAASCAVTESHLGSHPDEAESFVPVVNHRPQCAPYCRVHEEFCQMDTVGVVYGMVVLSAEARQLAQANPNASFEVNLGCVVLPFKEAYVLYCESCRAGLR